MENNALLNKKQIFQTEIDNEKLNKISNITSKESVISFYLKKKHNSANTIKIKVLISFCYLKENYEFLYQISKVDRLNTKQKYQIDIKEMLNTLLPRLEHIMINKDFIISYATNENNDNLNPKNGKSNNFEILDLSIKNKSKRQININFNNIRAYTYLCEYPFNIKSGPLFLDIPKDYILYLKFREKLSNQNLFINSYFDKDEIIKLDEEEENNKVDLKNSKNKKDKERTIQFVLKKLFFWKKLKEKTNMSSSVAAVKLNSSKKSLDEYFLLVKKAYEYKFDFTKHRLDKISLLRKYVLNCDENNYQKNANKFDKEIPFRE